MPRFFSENCADDEIIITGEDMRHITKSLRMKAGEALTVCNGRGVDYECVISEICSDSVNVKVQDKHISRGEPNVDITVFQCLPKSDKMDGIVQRAVEIGVKRIVPVLSQRCISRPDEKSAKGKIERWRKICLESAMQCGRGIVPEISGLVSFEDAVKNANADKIILFYEGGGSPLKEMGFAPGQKIAMFIGPEGGFEESEVELARENGAVIGSLGPRILRTQTASLAASAAIMLITDNI